MCHQWIKYGNRYGYPECCIQAFLDRNSDCENIILPNRIQKRVSNKTGFIPCSYCSWKILTGKCKLEDLIKNRKDRKTFPETNIKCYFPKKY